MFPTSISGTLELPAFKSVGVEELLSLVSAEMDHANARDIRRVGTKLSFRGGVFRLVSNWNVLVPAGSGEIEILPGTPVRVRYHFSCIQMLVLVSLIVLAIGASTISSHPSDLTSYLIPLLAWLWLFGMNYLVASARLPALVRRAVDA